MLRSLVGSEMCIRDRINPLRKTEIVQIIEDHIISGKGVFQETGVNPETCLLYTSDAADDLLCVDLGGRRIIKKKNNHN